MDRRVMLASLIAGSGLLASNAAAQESSSGNTTLYMPPVQRVEDLGLLHDLMEAFSFVSLITTTPALRITHVPTVLDRAAGPHGTIEAHISAQNPQREAIEGGQPAVMVFGGPHGYISPTWYAVQNVVPTWNFAVVHASGRPRVVRDPSEARAMLVRLVRTSESSVGSTGYDLEKLPAEYVASLLQGIVPFRMEISTLEGKFKLGGERSETDRQRLVAALETNPYREPTLHEVTESFFRMRTG